MLKANEKSKEIYLLDTTENKEDVLLSFPVSTKKTYYPSDGKIPGVYLLSVDNHYISVAFDDSELNIKTTKYRKLDGLQVSYDIQTKKGLIEIYQDGELRCEEQIDGHRHKFMLNIFYDPTKETNNTMTFESWNRQLSNTNIFEKDGPQAKHDLNKGRMSFYIQKKGSRTYLNSIFPDRYCTFSIVETDGLTAHFLDTFYKDGKKEEKTLAFVADDTFLGGSKKVYQDGRLISSGGLAQNEADHGPVYMYNETGKKTEYEYYYGRRVANWTQRKKIAKWVGGLAVAGALLYYGLAGQDAPEKIDTQTPPAAKQLNTKDNQHI